MKQETVPKHYRCKKQGQDQEEMVTRRGAGYENDRNKR